MKDQPNKETYTRRRPHGVDTTERGHHTQGHHTEGTTHGGTPHGGYNMQRVYVHGGDVYAESIYVDGKDIY